jgi:hypothetical protein
MAIMIPNDVEEFQTEGERVFFCFLQSVAKPDSRYVAWYLPDVNGREPDFLLYGDDIGLVVFEVKDWALNQIREADPHQFLVAFGERPEPKKNPLHQAHDYLVSIKDKIQKDGHLVSKEPMYFGNPKIPLNCGVVFPNINKYEYTEKGLEKVIGNDKIFFWDDLQPLSEICHDPSGQCFNNVLKRMFPPLFPFQITGRELNHLKFLMFPVVRIELPCRDPGDRFGHEIERLRMLDHHQEAIARKYDGGHRIIIGPSGSGKTLILVHKAALLKQYNPAIKKILFVCYNITLVNYIKRLLSDKGVGLGEGGVEVYHFFQLCSKILDEEVLYESEDSDYYNLVVQETLSRLEEKDLKYDAILVDEGQDFSDDMYKVITSLLNLKTYSLTIALDDQQTLYSRSQSWKEMGIQARGRVHRISCVYRNTSEIAGFADRFIGRKDVSATTQEKEQPDLFPDLYTFHGPRPEMKQFEDLEAMIGSVSDNIKKLIDSKECPASEIAVIYATKTPWNMPDKKLPDMIEKALDQKGVLYKWASEDYRAKKSYDITTNSVTISTIHSMKGLDYHSVFLVGLDFIGPKILAQAHTKNLVYVGMTRARYRLFIPYTNENELIKVLLSCV